MDSEGGGDRALQEWGDYCALGPDSYVEKTSPEYLANIEREQRELEKLPHYGKF